MNSSNYVSGDGNDGINFNDPFSYPIQWLQESEFARRQFHCNLHRVYLAKLGRPSRNLYKEELTSNINKIKDTNLRDSYNKACLNVPEGRSYTVQKAINTIANQMSGGVDTYDYQIYDPYDIIEADTEDLLSATCEQDYIRNHLERRSESISRDLTEAGIAAMLVEYCPETEQNKVLRINPKNIWFDTKYSSTGLERFRGYSTMISWKCVKEMIEKDGDEINLNIKAPNNSMFTNGEIDQSAKYSNRKIRSLNGLDIYVQDMNRLATSTQLQAWSAYVWEDYMHDLRDCYNLNWYHSFATDAKAKTNSGYMGDDVELTVIYDLANKIQYKILNRRYVVSANSTAFKRKMFFPIADPRTGEIRNRIDDFYLECPLKFVWEESDNRDKFPFPTSKLMTVLDIHDELCGWRAKRNHVSQILSVLRVQTNAADADSLRGLLNINGIVLDDIQGDITTIQFPYDYTAIDSEIEYRENLIKNVLNAYDQFDALQAMGDRASAAESGMALNAVAQGLATHQNAVMEMYAEIARQCIANRVAYSTRQEFPIINNGQYDTVTIQQMALSATITVKPKLAKKVEEKMLSNSALAVLNGPAGQWLNNAGVAYLISKALGDLAPRKMLEGFINEPGASEQEIALAQQQAQNQAQMLAQNQQAYAQNPAGYEVQNTMDNFSPDQIDTIVGTMMNDQGIGSLSELDGEGAGVGPVEEEGSFDLASLAQSSEIGGELANEPETV